jgi:hypothetical protein
MLTYKSDEVRVADGMAIDTIRGIGKSRNSLARTKRLGAATNPAELSLPSPFTGYRSTVREGT